MHLPRPRALRTDAAAVIAPPGSRRLALSVVVAGVLSAEGLDRTLAALASAERRGVDTELVVVDGGTEPTIAETAERHGARLIPHSGSRGSAFAAGVKAATSEWVMLLRAGTELERGWDATLVVFTAEERNRERGGVFPLQVTGNARATRRMHLRHLLGRLPSGAQGMMIRRRFLAHLGGIADLERGEDLVLARTLTVKRMAMFDVPIRVPAAEWPSGPLAVLTGVLRIVLFRLRVPPRWLQGLGD